MSLAAGECGGRGGPKHHNELVTWELSYYSDPKNAMTCMLGNAGATVNQFGGHPGIMKQICDPWAQGVLCTMWMP